MNTSVRVAVDRVADAVLIPVRAGSKRTAAQWHTSPARADGWTSASCRLPDADQEQLVVSDGVKPDERVALKDPIPVVK